MIDKVMVKLKAEHDIKFVLSLYTNMFIITLFSFLKTARLQYSKKCFNLLIYLLKFTACREPLREFGQDLNGHRTKYTIYTTKKILSSGNDYLNDYLNFAFPVEQFTIVVFIVMLDINSLNLAL